jgi:hypothetical protein
MLYTYSCGSYLIPSVQPVARIRVTRVVLAVFGDTDVVEDAEAVDLSCEELHSLLP